MTSVSTGDSARAAITADTVRHLAELSRIALNDAEVQSLQQDLNSILANVAKVSEVVNPEIAATSHPLPLSNVARVDEVADQLTRDEALRNAPEAANGMFRVSSILGEEQ